MAIDPGVAAVAAAVVPTVAAVLGDGLATRRRVKHLARTVGQLEKKLDQHVKSHGGREGVRV